MTWTHIKNAHVYAPEDRGMAHVVLWNGLIVSVGPDAAPPVDADVHTVEAEGCPLLPGLIDPHAHIMGASGVGGPTNRTPDQPISRLTLAGITTVVSPLGTDSLSRTLANLLMRAEAATAEGVSAYAYTGGWAAPVPTLMGDAMSDITFLARVVGIKVAIAEAMAPPVSVDQLAHYGHAAVIGGRLVNKQAVLHAHIGDRIEGLQPLWAAGKQCGLPLDRFVATHVNRNPALLEMAAEYAKAGGSIDVTGQIRIDRGYKLATSAAEAIAKLLDAGAPFERITLSSDSGGAFRSGDESRFRMAEPDSLWQTVRRLQQMGFSHTQIASVASRHAADLLGLSHKGRIASAADADVLLLSPDGDLNCVWSRGRLMVEHNRAIVTSDYE
ncbi:MAG: amidohydrolase family protein [bacterium]|jgi:beta-aspartyl-dipeptidase (metallo-type)|nr:amidohydrolase family protein [bacterium]